MQLAGMEAMCVRYFLCPTLWFPRQVLEVYMTIPSGNLGVVSLSKSVRPSCPSWLVTSFYNTEFRDWEKDSMQTELNHSWDALIVALLLLHMQLFGTSHRILTSILLFILQCPHALPHRSAFKFDGGKFHLLMLNQRWYFAKWLGTCKKCVMRCNKMAIHCIVCNMNIYTTTVFIVRSNISDFFLFNAAEWILLLPDIVSESILHSFILYCFKLKQRYLVCKGLRLNWKIKASPLLTQNP